MPKFGHKAVGRYAYSSDCRQRPMSLKWNQVREVCKHSSFPCLRSLLKCTIHPHSSPSELQGKEKVFPTGNVMLFVPIGMIQEWPLGESGR